MSVLVAMPTLGKRPVQPALEELAAQARSVDHEISLVLLHNSPQYGAELELVAKGCGVKYVQVAERGYSSVRNAALDLAVHHDVLVFIDDDEIPGADWLHTHLDALVRTGTDITTGPVVAEIPPGAPRWLDEGRLLRPRADRPSGPCHEFIATNNTAIRMNFVRAHDLRFDPNYEAFGEDMDFFCRCLEAGASIFWLDEARVVEYQDPERLTLRFLIRRRFADARFYTNYSPRFPAHIRRSRLSGKIARMSWGLAQIAYGLVRTDSPRAARGLSDIAAGVGGFVGLTEVKFARWQSGRYRPVEPPR
jgi:glycosyltransferase involved in cell wall biosynthesis